MKSKIYKITMAEHDYDEYDSFVVQAQNKESALKICDIPSESNWSKNLTLENIESVEIIGIANDNKEKEICSSYNAG